MAEVLFAWRASEHQHIERGSDWYWALGVIALSLAITSILFNNFLFALLIVIAAITFGMLASRPPRIIDVALGDRGLMLDDTLYSYEEMYAFWITADDEPTLLIDTPRFMTPDLVIPLDDIDPESVRTYLLEQQVPEVLLRESFLYKVMEFIGL
jgi:hypothetical protein